MKYYFAKILQAFYKKYLVFSVEYKKAIAGDTWMTLR